MSVTRRDFLKTFGLTAATLAAGPSVAAPIVSALENSTPAVASKAEDFLMSIVIRALPSNTGNVFIAPTLDMSKDKLKAMLLEPGAVVEFTHLGQEPTVFFDKTNLGDRVEISIIRARYGGDLSGGGGYIQVRAE